MKIKAIMALLVVMLVSCSKSEYKINITEKQVNELVSEKFPYDKNVIIARLTLENPYVDFKDNRVDIKIEYKGNLLEKSISGLVNVDGDIIFKKKQGQFYLSNFEIKDVTMNSDNINDKQKVISAINKILINYFDKIPVYTLDSDDFKESLVKLLLKDIQTEEDNFIVTLGT